MIDIRSLGFELSEKVAVFAERVRQFFYRVMLSDRQCPQCGSQVCMEKEGTARCSNCGHCFDPTLTYQNCQHCGGKIRIRVRRYECIACGRSAVSQFLFDGVVFDAAYFRQKMAESRQRKQQRLERVRRMLAGTRSEPIPVEAIDLNAVPGLLDALNGLSRGIDAVMPLELREQFDLHRYQQHVLSRLDDDELDFDDIDPLIEDERLDRIWRFVAVIFLANARQLDINQDGNVLTLTHCHGATAASNMTSSPEVAT